MSIGNVNSSERGSGARFNDGKVAMEFIPAHVLADFYVGADYGAALAPRAVEILYAISDFEERSGDDDVALNWALGNALPDTLDVGVERWRQVASVFAYGATKYAAWNWAKGMPWSVPLACIKRHAVQIIEAENDESLYDSESGISHIGHIAANIVMLQHYLQHFQEGDDRAPAECFGDVGIVPDEVEMLMKPLAFNVAGYGCERARPMMGAMGAMQQQRCGS